MKKEDNSTFLDSIPLLSQIQAHAINPLGYQFDKLKKAIEDPFSISKDKEDSVHDSADERPGSRGRNGVKLEPLNRNKTSVQATEYD